MLPYVKDFFFFGYRLSSDELGMGLTTTEEKVGIVSCIIPYYFNPWGTGSHLYPANTNTLRSGHRVEVLPTLVGLSLWDCLALAFCILIISHFR